MISSKCMIQNVCKYIQAKWPFSETGWMGAREGAGVAEVAVDYAPQLIAGASLAVRITKLFQLKYGVCDVGMVAGPECRGV